MDDNNSNNINNTDDINDIDETDEETGETEDYDDDLPEIKRTQAMMDAGYFNPGDEQKTRAAEKLFDLIEIASGAFLFVILLFTFVVRIVTVHGPSMEDTLYERDMLLISHLLGSPGQGDIVVVQVPDDMYKTPIIKRVIATEGQLIDFDFPARTVIIYENQEAYDRGDGVTLAEPYVKFQDAHSAMIRDGISPDSLPVTVGPGKVFVMGDNRNRSSDSRSASIGQVDVRNDIVGRVLLRLFPLNKFGIVRPNPN
jgi:signal peptidase I